MKVIFINKEHPEHLRILHEVKTGDLPTDDLTKYRFSLELTLQDNVSRCIDTGKEYDFSGLQNLSYPLMETETENLRTLQYIYGKTMVYPNTQECI